MSIRHLCPLYITGVTDYYYYLLHTIQKWGVVLQIRPPARYIGFVNVPASMQTILLGKRFGSLLTVANSFLGSFRTLLGCLVGSFHALAGDLLCRLYTLVGDGLSRFNRLLIVGERS